MTNLILASQSPRRAELLRTAGFRFKVRSRPVAEVRAPNEDPREYVIRLARAKADAAWKGLGDEKGLTEEKALINDTGSGNEKRTGNEEGTTNEIVLGADTVVVLDEQVLEKPVDAAEACSMLRSLSGRTHIVITGVCLRHAAGTILDIASTKVRFAKLDDHEIDEYVASGEPMDKAGAYAIQGLASKFVEHVDGCYFNVIGLPLSLIYRHLKRLAG